MRKLFKSEASQFALFTGFKFAGIFILVGCLTSYIVWLMIALNNVFFEAHGYMNELALREAYFDLVLKSGEQWLPYLFGLVVALFFAGVFMAKMLMRPFRVLANYCEHKMEGENAVYIPDQFSDYKLLTRFSDFFFQYIEDSRRKGRLEENTIPTRFLGIRRPVFEKVFFFHFFLLTLIIALVANSLLSLIISEIREDTVDLAVSVLKAHGAGTSHFFQEQGYIFDTITIASAGILFTSYMMLAFHLYGQVSGAVFGFFSTMRSFLKGNTQTRVHLLGYNHIRPFGRVFNKYLKWVEDSFSDTKTGGK
ncbi:MAG: hypothetical protein KC478_16150 [Bacteriovoracaceae bacterium]|nr:hypothetical protein [Bacteriovoracaceae bacterium]